MVICGVRGALDQECQRRFWLATIPEGFLAEEAFDLSPGEADQGTVQITTLIRGNSEKTCASGKVICLLTSPDGHLSVATSCPLRGRL